MSVKRVIGIENEYGISQPANPTANPMALSTLVVDSYANYVYPHKKIRWDYDLEDPLRDARGFDLSRPEADPSLITDEMTVSNVILTNGARFYVDHAHPEYATPEVNSPREALVWDRAGELIITKAAELASQSTQEIYIHKNNTDNKGVSYGTHENYLVSRETPFNKIISVLTTFFVTRQIFTGAGRLGVGVNEIDFEYQISQRADFFETLVGLETTMRRPIINTRDEPHADPNLYRRLHVIIGDANMSDVANLLKIGTTSLVLKLLEDSDLDDFELELDAPLEALKMVSQDLELKKKLKLKNGKYLTAIEIQYVFLERVQQHLEKIDEIDPDTQETLNWWQEILDLLREDIFLTVNYLDWVAKLNLIQNIKSRDNLKWSDSVLQMLDLQYADLNPNRSLARLLERKGNLKRLVGDAEIIAAVKFPPISTRAWFRGQSLLRFSNQIAGASWDSVIFDISADRPLLRIPTLDPLKGNQEQLGDIFESAKSAADLVMRLSHS